MGNTGPYPPSTRLLREVPNQRSGPRKPQHGAGVGGLGAGIPRVRYTPAPTLRARSVTPGALPGAGPPLSRLLANKGEIYLIFLKT